MWEWVKTQLFFLSSKSKFSITLCFSLELAGCVALSDPINGNVTFTGTVNGSTANYSCRFPYQIAGETLRTCLVNGDWSGEDPTCVASPEQMILVLVALVVTVSVIVLLLMLILVVYCIFRYKKKRKTQLPIYLGESVALGLRR